MSQELYIPPEPPDLRRGASWTLRVAFVGLALVLAWASVFQIDQVTRAPAQIIAADRTQVVQSPDGGVLAKLLVKEGDVVKAGQLVATLEKARAQAAADDSRAKVAALKITLARLKAEVYGKTLEFDPELATYKEYIANQTELYIKRKRAIDEDVAALGRTLRFAQDELKMNESLQATGDVSRADILRMQRQVADIQAQITNKRNKYFQDAQTDMTKAQEDLNTQTESLRERTGLLEHTDLQAPADGIVKNILVTTIGGVLKPGEVVLEIFPTGGRLIAEAKVSPADIAFIKMGQEATVNLDAYDSSIFGSMKGEVIYISADTLTEEGRQGKQTYYRVQIKLGPQSFKGKQATLIEVRPGMTANVSIKAVERSVLSYFVKPIAKTFQQSLGER